MSRIVVNAVITLDGVAPGEDGGGPDEGGFDLSGEPPLLQSGLVVNTYRLHAA